MPVDTSEALNRIRGEIYSRGVVLQDTVREHGWRYTPRDVRRIVQREVAWRVACGQLSREGVEIAQELRQRWPSVIGDDLPGLRELAATLEPATRIESIEDGAEFLGRVVSRWCRQAPIRSVSSHARPWQPKRRPAPEGFVWLEDGLADLPESVVDALIAVLARLVDAFLAEIANIQWPQLPPPVRRPPQVDVRVVGRDPNEGLIWGLPRGYEAVTEGFTTVAAVTVAGGGASTVRGPVMYGPAVVERVSLYSDVGFSGRAQLNLQSSGVEYPAGAAEADIFGNPLFLVASNIAGVRGSTLPWDPLRNFAEFWPRRAVGGGSFRMVLTVTNSSGATRFFAAAIDRRDVRRAA